MQNVMHAQFEPTGSPDPFQVALTCGPAIALSWQPSYLDCLPASYRMSSIRVREVAPTPGSTYTQTTGVAGDVGTRADEFSVSTVGPLINFPVTFSRPVTGKIFLPGIAEEDIDKGVIDSGLLPALDDLILALLTPVPITGTFAGDMVFCVSNSDHTDWKVPLAGYISPTIGTQRRRAQPNY